MGTRSPDSPEPRAPARGKKAVPDHLSCKVEIGRGAARRVRRGMAALCPDELRFHTGRTGRQGEDFYIHIPFDDIAALAADGPAGTLTVSTAEAGEVIFHLGRLAVAWKQLIDERPDLLRDLGVSPRSRVALVAVDDDELVERLAARVPGFQGGATDDAGGLDVLLAGVTHRADLARIGALAGRVRKGGLMWVVFPDAARGVDGNEIAAAGRAAGLAAGRTIVLSRGRLALQLSRS